MSKKQIDALVDKYIEKLSTNYTMEVEKVLRELGKLGSQAEKAAPILIQAFEQSTNPYLKKLIFRTVTEIGSQYTMLMTSAIDMAENLDVNLRDYVDDLVKIAKKLGYSSMDELLGSFLKDKEPSFKVTKNRAKICELLEKITDEKVSEDMLGRIYWVRFWKMHEAYFEEEGENIMNAIKELIRLEANEYAAFFLAELFDLVVRSCIDGYEKRIYALIKSMKKKADYAVPKLMKIVESSTWNNGSYRFDELGYPAVEMIASIKTPNALEALKEILKMNPDNADHIGDGRAGYSYLGSIREKAAEEIGKIGEEARAETEEALIALLHENSEHHHTEVAQKTAWALGEIKSKKAILTLEWVYYKLNVYSNFNSGQVWWGCNKLSKEAGKALRKIGVKPRRKEEVIIDILNNYDDFYFEDSIDSYEYAGVVVSMREVKDEIIPLLLKTFEISSNLVTRVKASCAIGELIGFEKAYELVKDILKRKPERKEDLEEAYFMEAVRSGDKWDYYIIK